MTNEVVKMENTQVAQQTDSQPMRLLELAISNNADIDKLERLIVMQSQWDARNAKREFLSAMARFQRNCPDIKKLKQGHNYKYAPLADIIAQTRDLISECGMSYRFEQNHDAGIRVTCIVSHEAGHSESNTMVAMPDATGSKNAIQAIGSTVQYLMRYTFVGAFGISTADEDIDGRLPDQSEVKIDRPSTISALRDAICSMGRTEEQFFEWFSKARKLENPIQSFSVMTDDELQWAARKLEAAK